MVSSNRDSPPEHDDAVVHTEKHETETIVDTISRAVAAKKNVPVDELAPLYNHIDPDALATLFDHSSSQKIPTRVEFELEEDTVIISDEGDVCIHEDGG